MGHPASAWTFERASASASTSQDSCRASAHPTPANGPRCVIHVDGLQCSTSDPGAGAALEAAARDPGTFSRPFLWARCGTSDGTHVRGAQVFVMLFACTSILFRCRCAPFLMIYKNTSQAHQSPKPPLYHPHHRGACMQRRPVLVVGGPGCQVDHVLGSLCHALLHLVLECLQVACEVMRRQSPLHCNTSKTSTPCRCRCGPRAREGAARGCPPRPHAPAPPAAPGGPPQAAVAWLRAPRSSTSFPAP